MLKLAFASTKSAIRKWFTFSGRASRAEYWWGMLGLIFTYIVVSIFVNILLDIILSTASSAGNGFFVGMGISLAVDAIVGILFIVPNLTLGSRRLHDTGCSGKFQFFYLLPVLPLILSILGVVSFFLVSGAMVIAGMVWVAIMVTCCFRGHDGDNHYGSESIIKESRQRDWLIPFFVFLALMIWGVVANALDKSDEQSYDSSVSSTMSVPVVPSEGVMPTEVPATAAPVPGVPSMDAPSGAPAPMSAAPVDVAPEDPGAVPIPAPSTGAAH